MRRLMLIGTALIVVVTSLFFGLAQQSKKGKALGVIDGQLSPCPASPNCVSSEIGTDPSKTVDPLPLSSWLKIPKIVSDLGGTIGAKNERYMAATFRTPLMGFVDDVEFRLSDDFVQIRSASRIGHSDLGTNAKRVAIIRSALGNQ